MNRVYKMLTVILHEYMASWAADRIHISEVKDFLLSQGFAGPRLDEFLDFYKTNWPELSRPKLKLV